MHMPVIVGIVVAVIFLIAFSEWFYNIVTGWKDFVLDDVYFRYRIAGVSALTILVMSGTFVGMAYVNECPNENRIGIFEKLNCEAYTRIISGTDKAIIKMERPRL